MARESDPFRYGGPWFLSASALPLEPGLLRSGRWATLVAATVCRPRRLAALILLIARTRSERVLLSDSSTGRFLRTYFSERSFGVLPRTRLCRGVLLLPRNHTEYLRGRRRQALRTNLTKAETAGIRCEVVTDRSHALLDQLEELRHGGSSRDGQPADRFRVMFAQPEMTIMVARDRRDRPLAHAAVVIDDTLCLVWFAMAISHEARWALHDYLVRTLIDRRVRYLLAEGGGAFGALGFDAGVQHYQRLLGYELRHLIPVEPDSTKGRRWMMAPVVVAAITAATLFVPPAAAAPGP